MSERHVGYGEADLSGAFHDSDTDRDDPSPNDLKLNGIVGGAQAGFNWQINNFVLGAEGDVSVTDWSDSKAASGDSEKISADVDLLASLRARVGFAVDALLIYATAGAAWSDANYNVADTLGRTAFCRRYRFRQDRSRCGRRCRVGDERSHIGTARGIALRFR